MLTIHKLGHLVIKIRNLEKAARFYREVLGFHEVARYKGMMAFFTIDRSNHHDLALMEVGPEAPNPPSRAVGLYHMAFKIGDDLEALRKAKAWLDEKSVAITGTSDHAVSQSIYIQDPDGNEIELYVDADPKVWKENPQAVATVRPLSL